MPSTFGAVHADPDVAAFVDALYLNEESTVLGRASRHTNSVPRLMISLGQERLSINVCPRSVNCLPFASILKTAPFIVNVFKHYIKRVE